MAWATGAWHERISQTGASPPHNARMKFLPPATLFALGAALLLGASTSLAKVLADQHQHPHF